jgi:hypothetical protein
MRARSVVMVALLKCCTFALSAVILAGCCGYGTSRYSPPRELIAWDGLGRSPDMIRPVTAHKPTREAKAEAVAKPEYDEIDAPNVERHSKEWWALRERADRVADAALTRKLVICQGCLPAPAQDGDATASVTR